MRTPKTSFGENYNTAQIYSLGFEFAFMSRNIAKRVYEQVTTFVYCKDFLHDALWAFLNKTKVQIYGFKYDYDQDKPLQMNRTVLAFRNSQYVDREEEFHDQLNNCMEFLQGIERILGFRPTCIYKINKSESPCWLILGDKRWQLAPALISMYTLFIRVGFHHTLGTKILETIEKAEKNKLGLPVDFGYAGSRDYSYIKTASKGIHAILKSGPILFHRQIKDNYPKALRNNGLHDSYGIVGFSNGLGKEIMPYWFRDEMWK